MGKFYKNPLLLKFVLLIQFLLLSNPGARANCLNGAESESLHLSCGRWATSATSKVGTEASSDSDNYSESDAASTSNPSATLMLPYGFYSEFFGLTAGYVYAKANYPQRDSMLVGTLMAGTKGSAAGFLIGRNLPLFGIKGGFIDPAISAGYYKENHAYIDGNIAFPNERAGTNNSNKDNFIEGNGADIFLRARFKYLLPIGHGGSETIPNYQLERGLLVRGATGAASLNPMKSGRTFLSLRPFFRTLDVDSEFTEKRLETAGADLTLHWDNRDYPSNPSAGQSVTIDYNLDPGFVADSWDVIQFEIENYFDFGSTQRFRQRTLAFDFWTAHSLSWEENSNGTIQHRPPAYTGATLGGLWRMRGYPGQRFNDRSAIYYSMELRLTPEWNPFNNWPKLQKHLGVQWVQFAPFVEVGRVASNWNFSELHRDMKYDAGIGVRAFGRGIIVRLDAAISEEGAGVQMMIGMPFGFR